MVVLGYDVGGRVIVSNTVGYSRAIFSVYDYSLGLILVLSRFAVVEGTKGTAQDLLCAALATRRNRAK